ncbi:hypothetical protein C8T65DRAFT_831114 [Cerioporus squamosus]|nr:hypothetical protein C8T65DRAFT_831114 [Cerioporus squamosus]
MPHPKDDPHPGISAAWRSKQHIILEQTQMSRHLINHLYFAWASSGLESSLYGLYSFALFLIALVTEYKYPHASLNVGPQAVFQEKRIPPTQSASGSKSEAASASKSGSSPTSLSAGHNNTHAGGATSGSQQDGVSSSQVLSQEGPVAGPSSTDVGPENAPAGTARSSQASASKNIQETSPEVGQKRTPLADFARMFIPSKPPKHLQSEAVNLPGDPPVPLVVIKDDMIIDIIEIKPLDEQVYETAQTTLEHKSSWDTVSVILIIGFFFTQFVPDASSRPPVTPCPPVPGSKPMPVLSPFAPFVGDPELLASQISKDNLNELLGDGKTRRAILRERSMPVIYHYNEPIFVLSKELGHKKTCTLTDKFIGALTTPLRHSKIIQEQVVIQPSWLDCNEAAIPTTNDQLNTDRIRAVLREQKIQASYDQDDALAGSEVIVDKVKKLSCQEEEDEADFNPSEPVVHTEQTEVRRSERERHKAIHVPVLPSLVIGARKARAARLAARQAAGQLVEEGGEDQEEAAGTSRRQPAHRARPARGGVQRSGASGSGGGKRGKTQ